MLVIRSREHLRLALPPDRTRAVVMTMGALHAGHTALIDAARQEVGGDGHVLVTVFVNPLQFGAGEDLQRYPRDEEGDLALCQEHGADAVFVPSVRDVYGTVDPHAAAGVTVDPGPMADLWEGAVRPGHFRGVLTVVLKLLNLSRPDVALFGEKDYQQLTLIRRMVADLDVPVRVVGVPTVREVDGLARSSRNAYLDDVQRALAAHFPRALFAGAEAADAGADPTIIVETVEAALAKTPALSVDYIAVTDTDLGDPPDYGPARLLAAVRLGSTRLLDNLPILLRDVA